MDGWKVNGKWKTFKASKQMAFAFSSRSSREPGIGAWFPTLCWLLFSDFTSFSTVSPMCTLTEDNHSMNDIKKVLQRSFIFDIPNNVF